MKYKWNKKEFYKTHSLFIDDFNYVKNTIKSLKDEKIIIKNINQVLYYLELERSIEDTLSKLMMYLTVLYETKKAYQQNLTKVEEYFKKLNPFYKSLSILSIEIDYAIKKNRIIRINRWANNEKLKDYKERLAMYNATRPKIKSVEILLSKVSASLDENLGNVLLYLKETQMEKTFLMNKKQLNYSDMESIISNNKNKQIRKQAYIKSIQTSKEISNPLSNLLSTFLQNKKNEADCYNQKIIDYSLFNDGIKTKNVKKILDTIKSNLDIFDDYLSKKKRQLNYRNIYFSDLEYCNLNQDFSLTKGRNLIYKAFKELGTKSYKKAYEMFNENKIFIVNPNNSFYSFAGYCTSYQDKSYILTVNEVEDISFSQTLAHEIGHAIHMEQLYKNNEYSETDPSLIFHEFASYTHELQFLFYQYKKTNDIRFLNNILSYTHKVIFQKGILSNLEFSLHKEVDKEKVITESSITNIYEGILNEFNPNNTITLTKECKNRWCDIRRSERLFWDFYELKYIISYCLAFNLMKELHYNNNKKILIQFNKFIKMGSDYRLNDLLNLFGYSLKNIDVLINDTFLFFKELNNEL